MTLTLIIMAAIAVIWLAERSTAHLGLAIAGLCFIAAVLLFVVADVERAILLSTILVVAIFGASKVKYDHSGLKLIVTDLPLVFAGTVPFFIVQYPLAVSAVIAGGIALILAAVATLLYAAGPPVSLGASSWSVRHLRHWPGRRLQERRRGCVLAAHRGRAALFLFGLHGLAARPEVLAAIRRARAQRHRRGAAAAAAGRPGAQPRLLPTSSSSSTNRSSIRACSGSRSSPSSRHSCPRKTVSMAA